MPVLNDTWDARLLKWGRIILMVITAAIPLAFCRETMYVFQIKTAILQYAGLSLALLMVAHHIFSAEPVQLFKLWAVRLIVVFLLWEVFKSFDSINSLVSFRQLSRVFWLPVIAISVPYFFRERGQLERLITVLLSTSVVVLAIAFLLYNDVTRLFLVGHAPTSMDETFDLYKVPVISHLLEWVFYPAPFDETIQQALQKGQKVFPFSSFSLFPGKPDAGTFGNKNFIAAYLNLVVMLMFYRAVCLFREGRDKKDSVQIVWFATGALLTVIAIAAVVHIIRLDNRGSQLGMMLSMLLLTPYLMYVLVRKGMSKAKIFQSSLAIVSFFVVFATVIYLQNPERVKSIASFSSATNELRVHTWSAFYEAWKNDREFPGFENDFWRMSTGFGLYTFRVIYPKYRSKRIFQIEHNAHNTETSHSHNEYLGYLGELGWIGLLLYLLMMWVLLVSFFRHVLDLDQLRDFILAGVLMYGLLALLIHQFVTVAVRYTGVGYHFWLMIGLVLAFMFMIRKKEGEEVSKRGATHFVTGGVFLALVFTAMPSWAYPIRWMRSQHFYEMGHIRYGQVRNFSQKLEQQKSTLKKKSEEIKRAHQQLQKLKTQGQDNPSMAVQLKRADEMLVRFRAGLKKNEQQFEKLYNEADRYFSAGYEYDAANYESIYIGANMNVQYAKTAMIAGDDEKAKRLFQQALVRYEKIIPEMPYFVQVRFWRGICYKGIGSAYLKKFRGGDQGAETLMKKNFEKALVAFDEYIEQDPVYPEVYFEKFLIYSNTGQQLKALNEIRNILICKEAGGYPLFDSDMRFDTLKLLNHYISHAPEEDMARDALQLYSIIAQYKKSSLLLPLLPKTERHGKNSLGFLK